MTQIINALTVDVEDYFHVAAFNQVIKPNDWDGMQWRFNQNTKRMLDLFDQFGVKATFFVLGWCAERDKALVAEIDRRGHEVASHGYSHQLVYSQTPEQFRSETIKSKDILESITGKPVKGYRAASYSITEKSLWAIDILAETGFEYDSSIFPVYHDNYGMPNSPKEMYTIETDKGNFIKEWPLSVYDLGKISIPVAGGGYFRLYPYFLTKYFLGRIIKKTGKPIIFYLHPWEIDPEQPRISAGLFSRFRHYNNLNECEGRLEHLLKDFSFSTVSSLISTDNSSLVFRF